MSSLKDVFIELNRLKSEGVFEDYAIGGGMAFLFYTDPVRTYDLDVFIFLPPQEGLIIQIGPLYEELQRRGFMPDREHITIHGTPVQFLPSYNELVDEGVEQAQTHDYEGVPVRVLSAEHLLALAWQTGGAKRRERASSLLDSGKVDKDRLKEITDRFGVKPQ